MQRLENRTADELYGEIERFAAESRASLLADGTAWSMHVDGKVPDNPVADAYSESGLRKAIATQGRIKFDKLLSPDFLLAIKHNAGFMAILDRLVERFACYGVVRNPLSVLASWQSVDIVNTGRLPVGERLDQDCARRRRNAACARSAALHPRLVLSLRQARSARTDHSLRGYVDTGGKALRSSRRAHATSTSLCIRR